ncbi:uncharacterized protein LOC130590625 [Beta vulgaris subsp. vulgaris]|uniref:uncharacterized protein LOC130590625 n=1 Tax=Beta vulgaris subsp. vulgaris TaxID=3555 RepID=UPI002546BE37|nr:uncharacterized protein LOC130590625 [Beta vulgaris subsp. vulgaris]
MLSDDGDCDGGPSTSRYEWGFAFDPPVVGDNLGPESSAAGNLETISGSLGSLSRTKGSSKVKKSRRKRVTRASARIRDKEFNVQLIPREYPNFKSKLMKFIYDEKPDANAEEVVMVKCGTLVATLEECKTVLGGTQCVHENYVRVAGAMYTRMWRRKFGNSSIRFMIDPTFAVRFYY